MAFDTFDCEFMTPYAIVIVCHPLGIMLADGPCGAKPPLVCRDAEGVWVAGHDAKAGAVMVCLPIQWKGGLVSEGWDRARRIVGRIRFDPFTGKDWWAGLPNTDVMLRLADVAVDCGFASRVIVFDLVDGRLTERAS